MGNDSNKTEPFNCLNSGWLVNNGIWAARYVNEDEVLVRYDGKVDFYINLFRQSIKRLDTGTQSEDLNRFEYHIIRTIAFHGGSVAKNEICEKLWGDENGDQTSKLAVHITSLKKKIKSIGLSIESSGKNYILNVE